MYPFYFFAFASISGVSQIIFTKPLISTSFLLALIVSNIGLEGLFSLTGHFFKSGEVAGGTGWPAGNPFQKEMGFTNVSTGIFGILSIWFHGDFRLATIIARSVFLRGVAYTHPEDVTCRKRFITARRALFCISTFFPFVLIGPFIANKMV